jgi:ribosomal protein S18 acetylase RimI-like enzyme
MDELRVQRLVPQQVDAVGALARTVWQATYPALISQAQIDFMLTGRYAANSIADQLNDPRHAWWTAQQHTLVGFAHASIDGADCKLDKLYVHPDSQRRGIGRALLHAVRDWAQAHGARRLWLQVNRGNTQALAAYRQYGFRIVESRVFEIGDGFVMDDHVMELPL